MSRTLTQGLLLAAACLVTAHASAEITFYSDNDFHGRSFTSREPVDDFSRIGFNDRASSIVITNRPWEVCTDAGFSGSCVVLQPGSYPNLRQMNLNDRLSSARAVRGEQQPPPPAYPVQGDITFYERRGFNGQTFVAQSEVRNLNGAGFNDKASSIVVGHGTWEVCDDQNFRGHCAVLRPGEYPDLNAMGMNNTISSVRPVRRDEVVTQAPPPMPAPVYDARPRYQERLYQVNVTSVRAVFAQQQQRCWVEREQVVQERPDVNVGGAIVGGILGGVLGHQIGSGTGRDATTAIGAIAGTAIGANVGRNGEQVASTRDVQRCAQTPAQGRPDYWDVTYNWRGVEHHVQAQTPPGQTITVNEQGEPRT